MARARNIKPGFFKNEYLAELPAFTRLLFIGLWCVADREGRFEDRPRRIKMELFPADDVDVDAALGELDQSGFLARYEVDGKRYAQITNFTKHQMPHHKEVASEIPAPAGHQQVTKHAYDVPAQMRNDVFVRDGNKCLRCEATESLSIDHIVPLASGGDNSKDNLQTLCKSCNSSKGNSTKDYRKDNAAPTLSQRSINDGASCPSDSLIPDSPSLIPDSGNQREEKQSPPAAQSSRAPKASRLPADWQLPADWEAWALTEQPSWTPEGTRKVADSFRDYWAAKGGADARKVDWEATWRNWVRREKAPGIKPFATAEKFDPLAYVNRNRTKRGVGDVIDV